ncbi:MAG: hypothetical protein ACRENA_06240 [Vulcanimicrobiaceae bacterium]
MTDIVSVVLPAEKPQDKPRVAVVAAAPLRKERPALRLFATRAGLLHSLIAAEVLSPAVALRGDSLLRETGV